MNYSRRQLYALGEPLGESVTRLKPGGRVYGGGSSAPEKTTQVNELPDWAKGYAKSTLAKTAALSNSPYQAYNGERIAGFQPLQEKAFKTIGDLDAGPEGFSKGISTYMSPYVEQALNPQIREASRASKLAGLEQQAASVGRGAFGGSRDALMRMERERNLGQQVGDIRGRGYQAAYDSAANQFRQGVTQQTGLAQMQGQMGALQQQQAQRPLDMAYQDFINQQNHPYKQLGFMSDMIRGLPVGQQSTSSIYQAGPSGLQTLGALGMGAYGFNQMFGSPNQQRAADGGLMESYADGGVTGQDSVENIISKLSPEQLRQAKEAALNRRDIQTVEMIDQRLAELAQSASLQNGLGFAFDQIPPEQQEAMMAGGGIVAFAGPTRENNFSSVEEDPDFDNIVSEVDPTMQQQELAKIEGIQYKRMTPQQRKAAFDESRRALQEGIDASPYANFERKLTSMEAEDAKGLAQAKGLAALSAIPAILQGSSAIRGIGAGLGSFGGAYSQALQANKAQQRAAMSMRMNLAEAQRKERMGLNREALTLANQASKDHNDEQMFGLEKAKAMATIAARTKPTTAKPNFDIENRNAIAADLKSTTPKRKGETDEQYETRLQAMAAREIYGAKGTKDITSRSNVTSDQTRDIVPGGAEAGAKADTLAADLSKAAEAAAQKVKSSIPYLQAMKQKDQATMDRLEKEAREGVTKGFQTVRQTVNPNAQSTPASKSAPAPAPKPAPKSVLPPGSTTGKLVPGKGYEVFVNGKLVGYAK
jgi:hypothetical protein